jgi:16S rRNA (cytosine967-C5)-methyltransferase
MLSPEFLHVALYSVRHSTAFYNLCMTTASLSALPQDSLALSLHHSAACVAAVLQGSSLNDALVRLQNTHTLHAAQRGAAQDLAFYTLRRLGLARALAIALVLRTPDAPVAALLYVALALLSEAHAPKYPAHTVTDQAVRAAQALPNGTHVKGLVNAVLRRFLREREALLAQALQDPSAQWNLPAWWLKRLQRAYPKHWQHIAGVAQTPASLVLRANVRINTAAQLVQRFAAEDIAALVLQHQAVLVRKPQPVTTLPGFAQGAFSVQDAGAQLAAALLDARPGQRVLDACAAPGGKTAHVLELTDCHVTALDSDIQRLARVHENLHRLKLHAQVLQGDAAQPATWWDGTAFDRILVDAPCSASGIVRRHPDIAWLRREQDLKALVRTQKTMLDALWSLLNEGGRLLYATCSVFPEEGEFQASAFVQRNRGVKRLNAPGQLLPVAGQRDNHDGFYYALFEKTI